MKNKKSKIIVPALGLILLSTAASISGSVAWFTANRTAQIKAGEFAVVKTADDLTLELGGGVGTSVNGSDDTLLDVTSGYSLTDASFNHTAILDTNTHTGLIIAPDTSRANVASATQLNAASTSNLLRGLESAHTYSAFTWTMTFTVAFSGSSTKAQGLFIDTANADTFMHQVFKAGSGDLVVGQAVPSGYFSDAKCTTAATGNVTADTSYYKPAFDGTGQAFRIAFVPTAISTTDSGTVASTAYTKIWSSNEGTDTSAPDAGRDNYVTNTAADVAITNAAYANTTVKLTGYNNTATYSAEATANTKVFMKNDGSQDKTASSTNIPANDARTTSTALTTDANYLGYFGCNPGKSVSITYTCVAWYEGTHPKINGTTNDFEIVTVGMKFGVSDLAS